MFESKKKQPLKTGQGGFKENAVGFDRMFADGQDD